LSLITVTIVVFSFAGVFAAVEGREEREDAGTGTFRANVTWTYGTSLYFCAITLTTIGYGDLSPQTVPGKIILLIFGPLGLAATAWSLSSICDAILTFSAWKTSAKKGFWAKVMKSKTYCALVMYVVLLLVGAVLFGYVEKDDDGNRWGFFNGLYFTFITLTTIGYGDFSPSSTVGRVCVIFFAFFGLGIIAFLLGEWGQALSNKINKKAHKRAKKSVPMTALADDIIEFVKSKSKKDEDIMAALEQALEKIEGDIVSTVQEV